MLAALLLASVLVSACRASSGTAGVAWLRDESAEPINVSIDQPSHGLFGGTDHIALGLPPWQKGWCYALGYGINAGSVTISVEGPSVPFPISTTFSVPATPPTDITVVVDSKGEVHFSRAAPLPEKGGCVGYHEVVPTSPPH